MEYLINIIQGDIQYFLWLLVTGVIFAILTGRVEVIIKVTTEKIVFIIKKNFLQLIHSYVNTELKKIVKNLPEKH